MSNLSLSMQQQHQQQQQQMTQPVIINRNALADGEYLPSAAAPEGYNGMPQSALSQYSSVYLRDGGYPRSAPSDAFPGRLSTDVYNREGYTPYPTGRSPPDIYGAGVIRGPRRRVSLAHSPYPDPHAFGYGGMDTQSQRYGNGAANDEAPQEPLDMYRHRGSDSHPSQLSGPGWPPHQPHAVHASAHTPQIPSQHHTPEHVHQPDDEPLLTSHVSLGSNRLPPDSTLLTPLPGYEPEAEHGAAAWGTGAGGEF